MAYNKKAQAKYDAKCKVRPVKMFPTDKDIEDYLEQSSEPFSTLVKRLIREEIAKKKASVHRHTFFAQLSVEDDLTDADAIEDSYVFEAANRDEAVAHFADTVGAHGYHVTPEPNGLEITVRRDGRELIYLLDEN